MSTLQIIQYNCPYEGLVSPVERINLVQWNIELIRRSWKSKLGKDATDEERNQEFQAWAVQLMASLLRLIAEDLVCTATLPTGDLIRKE